MKIPGHPNLVRGQASVCL